MMFKRKNNAKSIPLVLFIALFIFLLNIQAWAGPPGNFQAQALELGKIIGVTLVEHRYCADQNDCNIKKFRFVGRTSTGIEIEVYRIHDPQVIQEILNACIDAYTLNQQRMDVSLSIYRQPHEEMMGFAKWQKKPFVSLHLKGEHP